MNNRILYLVVAVVVVAVIAGAFLLYANNLRRASKPSSFVPVNASSQELFNNSQYAPYAYMIYPNVDQSAAAQVAISDFNMSIRNSPNDSVNLTMTFTDTGASYSVIVKPTDKLYFIDRNLGDDSAGRDGTGGDDGYILVNSTGYIEQLKYPLPNA
jgi:hypothetical protein